MRDGLFDTTLASKVYERVRQGIVSGELRPGQPMSRRRIATELRTSPLPVASAFQRLEFEGLLESRPRAGTRVRAVSLNDVRDHFVVWEALETQVAMCAANGSMQPIKRCARSHGATSVADVRESPLANSVTLCPCLTSSSVKTLTTRSVPP